MHRSRLRGVIGLIIILITLGVFAYYITHHHEVVTQIAHINGWLLAELLALYIATIIALGLVFMASLACIGIGLPSRESMLVTMYSAIVNFFGPLQSGPAFRAVYLKQKYGVKLRNYTLATIAYYLWYAAISCLFLLSGLAFWWLIGCIALGIVALIGLYHSNLPLAVRVRQLPLKPVGYLGLATALQLSLVALIYYTELRSIMPHVSLGQAIIYSGAANLALFVSVTPGAIGIRESFLVFSQHLHHIGNNAIVAANVIDRSVYILLLAVLAVVIFGTHAQKKLQSVTKSSAQNTQTK